MTIIGHSYSLVKSSTKCAPALVGDRVFEGDTTVEIWRGREYQLAIAEGHSAIVDGNRATFGNGLTVDGIDGQTIAIGIRAGAHFVDILTKE